ncbi:hypothetical protein BTA30_11020 [Bacillus swezeyi]|uniref:Uncharacterized protein n=1 Tax=Bacillus swezeyi TaxID=1925020 RepID=A0A1R1QK00_9BACI|nr:hypothetical protein BW143_12540 [Bacillus swezeyi]OMI30919.1 hypothetical protein BTA30_11020 [Bacillus swezeyi]
MSYITFFNSQPNFTKILIIQNPSRDLNDAYTDFKKESGRKLILHSLIAYKRILENEAAYTVWAHFQQLENDAAETLRKTIS